jgi:hypothetical protein
MKLVILFSTIVQLSFLGNKTLYKSFQKLFSLKFNQKDS